MNISDRYYPSTNRTFLFEVIDSYDRFGISVLKWSSLQEKHIFTDNLCQECYLEMLGEPDQLFESLFDNHVERDLSSLLTASGILFHVYSRRSGPYSNDLSEDFIFENKVEAEKAVKLLQDQFWDTTER